MRRDRLPFFGQWARLLRLVAILILTVVACARSETPPPPDKGMPFELEDGRTSWKGRIIGLVTVPRQYKDLFFGEAVNPEQAASMPEGTCIVLLGELSPIGNDYVPDMWLIGF